MNENPLGGKDVAYGMVSVNGIAQILSVSLEALAVAEAGQWKPAAVVRAHKRSAETRCC